MQRGSGMQCKTGQQQDDNAAVKDVSGAKIAGIIDHKGALLSVAGTAVTSNCEPCLERIAMELEPTGITVAEIRQAVDSGRFLGA